MTFTAINTPIKINVVHFVNIITLFMGVLLNIVAYQSVIVVIVAAIFYGFGVCVLRLPFLGGYFERYGYRQVFIICWFMSGVSAIYTNYLGDVGADSARFFDLAVNELYEDSSLRDFQSVTEGAGAVVIWRHVHALFSMIGVESVRYVGILTNICAVAFSCVFSVKIARLIYGNDAARLKRLILLFSCLGIFWLFATMYLRDAFVLLGVTLLIYSWTLFIARPSVTSLIILLIFNITAVNSLGFFRAEFKYLSYPLFASYIVSFLMFDRSSVQKKLSILFLIIVSVVVFFSFYLNNINQILLSIMGNNSGYTSASMAAASLESLGATIIVDQPFPVRMTIGLFYLYVQPIPFWVGFQFESVYHLFKSFNVLVLYFLIPLFILSLRIIFKYRRFHTPALIFQVFIIFGFSFAVAITSLEGRHLGVFMVPFLLVSLVPDLTNKRVRQLYKRVSAMFILMMMFIHMFWIVLKI